MSEHPRQNGDGAVGDGDDGQNQGHGQGRGGRKNRGRGPLRDPWNPGKAPGHHQGGHGQAPHSPQTRPSPPSARSGPGYPRSGSKGPDPSQDRRFDTRPPPSHQYPSGSHPGQGHPYPARLQNPSYKQTPYHPSPPRPGQKPVPGHDHMGIDQAINQTEPIGNGQMANQSQVSREKRKLEESDIEDRPNRLNRQDSRQESIHQNLKPFRRYSEDPTLFNKLDDAHDRTMKRRRTGGFKIRLNLNLGDGYDSDSESSRFIRDMRRNEEPSIIEASVKTCGNCLKTGHGVFRCWHVKQSGFITGCAICNAHDHLTSSCSQFPQDIEGQVQLLVFQRANLPPLEGKYWYPLMWRYMEKYPEADVKGLPWTLEFSKRCHQGTRLQEDLALSMERCDEDLRHVDPETKSWGAAKKHFNGNPKSWGKAKQANKTNA